MKQELNEEKLFDTILNESYYPITKQVLLVKNFLDKNFGKEYIEDIDSNGYPVNRGVVNMILNGVVVKQMQGDEVLSLLDDKFRSIIKDNDDRHRFLKQVLTDWFNNNISPEGILSVNKI